MECRRGPFRCGVWDIDGVVCAQRVGGLGLIDLVGDEVRREIWGSG